MASIVDDMRAAAEIEGRVIRELGASRGQPARTGRITQIAAYIGEAIASIRDATKNLDEKADALIGPVPAEISKSGHSQSADLTLPPCSALTDCDRALERLATAVENLHRAEARFNGLA